MLSSNLLAMRMLRVKSSVKNSSFMFVRFFAAHQPSRLNPKTKFKTVREIPNLIKKHACFVDPFPNKGSASVIWGYDEKTDGHNVPITRIPISRETGRKYETLPWNEIDVWDNAEEKDKNAWKEKLFGKIVFHEKDSNGKRTWTGYELYFTPSLSIWQLVHRRRKDGKLSNVYGSEDDYYHSQYVGGNHHYECYGTTDERLKRLTFGDRCIMPAIGINSNSAIDPLKKEYGGLTPLKVQTNYGCRNSHYSAPWPIHNYQGATCGSGELSYVVKPPTWDQTTQTLTSVTQPLPWTYYPGINNESSQRFRNDYKLPGYHDTNLKKHVADQIETALGNVQLTSRIRILADGTIQLTYIYTPIYIPGKHNTADWFNCSNRPSVNYSSWAIFDYAKKGCMRLFDKDNKKEYKFWKEGDFDFVRFTNGKLSHASELNRADFCTLNAAPYLMYFIDEHSDESTEHCKKQLECRHEEMGMAYVMGSNEFSITLGPAKERNPRILTKFDLFSQELKSTEQLKTTDSVVIQQFLLFGSKKNLNGRIPSIIDKSKAIVECSDPGDVASISI